MKPNITWRILEDDTDYVMYNNYTVDGSYTEGDTILKKLQVYNNISGETNIDDAKNAEIVFAFKNYEDNFLLNLISIRRSGTDKFVKLDLEANEDEEVPTMGVYEIGTLNGVPGLGSHVELDLKIGPLPANLKTSLKSVIIYLRYE